MMITTTRTICLVRPSDRQHVDEIKDENDDDKGNQSADEKRHEIPRGEISPSRPYAADNAYSTLMFRPRGLHSR
jgi:hypothetical protein